MGLAKVSDEDTKPQPARSPVKGLSWLAGGALVVRLLYIFQYGRHLRLGWDATWYTGIGDSISAGRGYSVTCPVISSCVVRQTALFPPVLPTFYAAANKVGVSSELGRELLMALIGTATVFLVGWLGFRVTSNRSVAYVAAGLAALSPLMIVLESSLMTEGIAALLAALLAILLVDQIKRPRAWRWFALGVVVGLAALTRGEGPVWFVVIVLPCALFLVPAPMKTRLGGLAIALATMAVIVTPWMMRNEYQFGTPYLSQPNLYGTIAATNCKAGYYGKNIGAWTCVGETQFDNLEASGTTETAAYEAAKKRAVDYATAHVGRWPVVVVAREARAWSLLAPFHFQTGATVFRQLITLYDWMLLVASVAGAVIAIRSRLPVWPLLLLCLSVTLTIAVTYGNPRYLATAGPALAVFSALALVKIAGALARPAASTAAPASV